MKEQLLAYYDSNTTIRSSTGYYVKALAGKTAAVTVSTDKEGKNVGYTDTFTDGIIVEAANMRYITISNAELMPVELAPKSKIISFTSKEAT